MSSLQFYLKWTVSHILLKIVTIFSSFCKTLQIDDFKVSRLMVKTSQLNLFLDKIALMLLYFLIHCQDLKILSRHYFRTSNFLNILDKSTGYYNAKLFHLGNIFFILLDKKPDKNSDRFSFSISSLLKALHILDLLLSKIFTIFKF